MKVGTDGVLLGAWVNVLCETKILDIGTGTGLIALMLAQRSPASIDALEIECMASAQAAENVAESPWAERVTVINEPLQGYSSHFMGKYDLIVSNPPFFNNSLKAPNENRNMARHNDTLSFTDLLLCSNNLLSPNGRFAVILPYADSPLFIVDAALQGLYCIRKTNVRSSHSKRPHRVLMEFSRKRQKAEENELFIYAEQGGYTDEYKQLTCNFYLK